MRPGYARCLEVSGPLAPELVKSWQGTCAHGGGTVLGTGEVCPPATTGSCEGALEGLTGLTFVTMYYDAATAAADATSCTDSGYSWTPAGP
jgi:hypothetical protein